MRSYNSDRCWPRTQKTHAHEQTAQRSKSSSINDEARLLSTPLPQCGGVIYYHLPKASGATIECFLGAQPEFSCCYRANCGLCRSWKARLSEPSSSVCQHRGLLPETIPGWREHRTQPAGQSRAGHAFVLPDALIKLSSEHASSTSADWWNASSVMRSLRFVATHHLGPDRATPGMHLNSRVPAGPGVLPAAFVRDALLGTTLPASCRIILVTVLRHPVAQLISAWHYTHRREPLASFAQRHSSTLLGVVANGLQLKPSLLSSHPRHAAFVRYVRRMASQRPSAGLDTLLSFFDGACVPLGVPRPGHTGIGSWSAYPHTIYIRHTCSRAFTTVSLGRLLARYTSICTEASCVSALFFVLPRTVVGHVERFDETILLLVDAAGFQAPLACPHVRNSGSYNRDNASEWQLVAAVVRPSGLVPWYTTRLRAFDATNQRRGPSFARRVQRLSQYRRDHSSA